MSFGSGPLRKAAKPYTTASSSSPSSSFRDRDGGESEHSVKRFIRKVVNKIDETMLPQSPSVDNVGKNEKSKTRGASNSYSPSTSSSKSKASENSNSFLIYRNKANDDTIIGTQGWKNDNKHVSHGAQTAERSTDGNYGIENGAQGKSSYRFDITSSKSFQAIEPIESPGRHMTDNDTSLFTSTAASNSSDYALNPKELQSTLPELVVTSPPQPTRHAPQSFLINRTDTSDEKAAATRIISPPTPHLQQNTASSIRYSASNYEFRDLFQHARNRSDNSTRSSKPSREASRQTSPVSANRNDKTTEGATDSHSRSSSQSNKRGFLSALKDVLGDVESRAASMTRDRYNRNNQRNLSASASSASLSAKDRDFNASPSPTASPQFTQPHSNLPTSPSILKPLNTIDKMYSPRLLGSKSAAGSGSTGTTTSNTSINAVDPAGNITRQSSTPPRHPTKTPSQQYAAEDAPAVTKGAASAKESQSSSKPPVVEKLPVNHRRQKPLVGPEKESTEKSKPITLNGRSLHESHIALQAQLRATDEAPSLAYTSLVTIFYFLLYLMLHTVIDSSVICIMLPWSTWLATQYLVRHYTTIPSAANDSTSGSGVLAFNNNNKL